MAGFDSSFQISGGCLQARIKLGHDRIGDNSLALRQELTADR